MDCLYINDLDELAHYMACSVGDKSEVVAVLFFEEAKELMKIFLSDYDVEIGVIDITNFEYDGYEGEYYVSLTEDGMFSVEPAWGEDKYLMTCADLMLIDGDASYGIVERNMDSECVEIRFDYFDSEDDCDDDCCECCGCHCDDDEVDIELDVDCDIELIYEADKLVGARMHPNKLFSYLFGI